MRDLFSQCTCVRKFMFRNVSLARRGLMHHLHWTRGSIGKFSIREMDERLESSWRLVYYQVSGEPGIAGCSRRSDIYLGECGVARASLFTDRRRVILFFAC